MRSTLGEVRRVVREALGNWIVRGGSEVLVRGVKESPKDWRYITLQKVTYFSDDELVRKPRGLTDNQTWTFKRGDMLYAIAERQFYQRPQ
jgi:hypothetical protein